MLVSQRISYIIININRDTTISTQLPVNFKRRDITLIEMDDLADQLRYEAGLLIEKGEYDEALKVLDASLTIDPSSEDAWRTYLGRAMALEGQHKFQDAITCLRQAVELNPDFEEKLQEWLEDLTVRRDGTHVTLKDPLRWRSMPFRMPQQAPLKDIMDKILSSIEPETPEIVVKGEEMVGVQHRWFDHHWETSEILLISERLDKVLDIEKNIVEQNIQDGDTLVVLPKEHVELFSSGKLDALESCRKGVWHVLSSQYVQALEHFDRALEIYPEYEDCWYRKGILLAQIGRYDGASECLEHLYELNPDFRERSDPSAIPLIETITMLRSMTVKSRDSAVEQISEDVRINNRCIYCNIDLGDVRECMVCGSRIPPERCPECNILAEVHEENISKEQGDFQVTLTRSYLKCRNNHKHLFLTLQQIKHK